LTDALDYLTICDAETAAWQSTIVKRVGGVQRRYLLLAVIALLVGLIGAAPTSATAEGVIAKAAKGKIRPAEMSTPAGVKVMPGISSGTLNAATTVKDLGVDLDEGDIRADNAADPGGTKAGTTIRTVGCGNRNTDHNVRVNQDCTFRRQAEELIKANPADPSNLVAGQNDSRIGFNHCGFAFSFDSGRHWGDGLPPFFQHLNNPSGVHTVVGGPGTLHSYDAASDPALAVDSQGRAFYSCIVFDVNTDASAVFVSASVPGAGGSFYNNVPQSNRKAGTSPYVAAEDNSPLASHDKEFIVADAFQGSPNRDNVYVTWTVFKFDASCVQPGNAGGYCSSAIFGSMSTDHAVTWSKPEEISGRSSALCFAGNFFDKTRNANDCDFDQGSDPIVRPDGSLLVVFNNNNTALTNPNAQQLAVTCHPGGGHLNCASPAKVGDDVIVGRPRCNFGRGPEACIPGAFIRTNDFPRIAQNNANGQLSAVWQDNRTGELDIHLSSSSDGVHWTVAARPVNPDTGWDHYFAAADAVASNDDGPVAVSYYRTLRVPNENSHKGPFAPGDPGVQQEPSAYFLSAGQGGLTPFVHERVSPIFSPPTGNQAGFNGDYSGLVLVGDRAHPIWSDTRNVAPAGQVDAVPAPDEDIFTDSLRLPSSNEE